MADKLDQAVAAAEAKEQTVEMIQTQINIQPDGRPVVLAVPKDITDREICHLVGALIEFTNQLRAQRDAGPASRIILPRPS